MLDTQQQLSKWWRTKSCKDAMRRAQQQKKNKIKKLRAYFKAKQEKLRQDVENWQD